MRNEKQILAARRETPLTDAQKLAVCQELRRQDAEKIAALVSALEDAEFLLRKVGINPAEAGAMAESCTRSAGDARAALGRAGGAK